MAFSGDGVSDHRTTTVAIILGVLGAIAIAAILYYVTRMKPRRESVVLPSPKVGYAFTGFGSKGQQQQGDVKGGKHIRAASKITPFAFGANGDGPVFDHEPGTNMRIATRRSNGVWAFHELDPHSGSPLGVQDPVPTPTPISPFNSPSPFDPYSPTTPSSSTKGHTAKTPSSSAASTFSFEPHGYAAQSINQRKRSIGNYLEFGPTSLRTSPSTTTLNTTFTHSTTTTNIMTPTLPSPAYGPDSPVVGAPSPTSSTQRPTTPLAPAPPTARTFTR